MGAARTLADERVLGGGAPPGRPGGPGATSCEGSGEDVAQRRPGALTAVRSSGAAGSRPPETRKWETRLQQGCPRYAKLGKNAANEPTATMTTSAL